MAATVEDLYERIVQLERQLATVTGERERARADWNSALKECERLKTQLADASNEVAGLRKRLDASNMTPDQLLALMTFDQLEVTRQGREAFLRDTAGPL